MKARIFVVTLAAASLLSFGAAYAKPHGHSGSNSVSVANVAQFGQNNTATVIQAQNIGIVAVSVSVGGSKGYP